MDSHPDPVSQTGSVNKRDDVRGLFFLLILRASVSSSAIVFYRIEVNPQIDWQEGQLEIAEPQYLSAPFFETDPSDGSLKPKGSELDSPPPLLCPKPVR